MTALSPGAIFDGHFEIVEMVASGGSGVVYKAKQIELARVVALKVLLNDGNEHSRARFLQESKHLATLDHPAIARVYTSGICNGSPYLSMDFISGMSLSCVMAEKKLSVEQVVAIASDIVSALKHAHDRGIVHRDVKPGNIMVADEVAMRAVLVDFGLAKQMDGSGQHLTKTSAVLGTPSYLSPEQCIGKPADERSDIYSTGCVLYEMLTGRPPFSGENSFAVIYAHLNSDPEPLPESVPQWLAEIVARCMEKAPERRVQSTERLLALLNREQAITVPSAPRATKKFGARPVSYMVPLLMILTLVAAFAYWYVASVQTPSTISQLEIEVGRLDEKLGESERKRTEPLAILYRDSRTLAIKRMQLMLAMPDSANNLLQATKNDFEKAFHYAVYLDSNTQTRIALEASLVPGVEEKWARKMANFACNAPLIAGEKAEREGRRLESMKWYERAQWLWSRYRFKPDRETYKQKCNAVVRVAQGYAEKGPPDAAYNLGIEGLELAKRADSPCDQVAAYAVIAQVCMQRGATAEAWKWTRESDEFCSKNRGVVPAVLCLEPKIRMGQLYNEEHKFDKTIALLEPYAGLVSSEQKSFIHLTALYSTVLAYAYMESKQFAKADSVVHQAVALNARAGHRGLDGVLMLYSVAMLAAQKHRAAEARMYLADGLKMLKVSQFDSAEQLQHYEEVKEEVEKLLK